MAEKISQQLEEIKNALHNLRTEIEANSIVSVSRQKIQPKFSRFTAQKALSNAKKLSPSDKYYSTSKKNAKPDYSRSHLSKSHLKHTSSKDSRSKFSIYPQRTIQKYKYDFDNSDEESLEESYDYSDSIDSDLSEDSFDVDSYLNAHKHSIGSSSILDDDDSFLSDSNTTFDSNSFLDGSDEDDSIPSIKINQKTKPVKNLKSKSNYPSSTKHHATKNPSSKPKQLKKYNYDIDEDEDSDLNDDESLSAILSKLDFKPKIKTYEEYDDDSNDIDLIRFTKPVAKPKIQTKSRKNDLDDISLDNLSYELEESIEEIPQSRKKPIQKPIQKTVQKPASKSTNYDNSSEIDVDEYLNRRRKEEQLRQARQEKIAKRKLDIENLLLDDDEDQTIKKPLQSKTTLGSQTKEVPKPTHSLLSDDNDDDEDIELDNILNVLKNEKKATIPGQNKAENQSKNIQNSINKQNNKEEPIDPPNLNKPEEKQNDLFQEEELSFDNEIDPQQNLNDDELNDDKVNDDEINDDKLNDNKVNDDEINDEKLNDDELNDDELNDDKLNDDALNDDKVNNDKLNDDDFKDDEINDDEIDKDEIKIDENIKDDKIIKPEIDIKKLLNEEEDINFGLELGSQEQNEENTNNLETIISKEEEESFDFNEFLKKADENNKLLQQFKENNPSLQSPEGGEEEDFDVDQFLKLNSIQINSDEDDIDLNELATNSENETNGKQPSNI